MTRPWKHFGENPGLEGKRSRCVVKFFYRDLVMNSLKIRLRSARGASLIEYSTLACLVCTALVVPLQSLSSNSVQNFSRVNSALTSQLFDNTVRGDGSNSMGDDATSNGSANDGMGTGTWGSIVQQTDGASGNSQASGNATSSGHVGSGNSGTNSQSDSDKNAGGGNASGNTKHPRR